MWSDRPRHSDAACARLVDRLLVEPGELLAVFAPEGWERSPLFPAFHPTAEQVAKETERIRRNLAALRGKTESVGADDVVDPFDDIDDLASDEREASTAPIDADQEIIELFGHALWDVFSDNHTVIDAEGTAYELGSFRGSASFIAESINRRYDKLGARYHYMDFYMGSLLFSERADFVPVCEWIFARLKEQGCRWIYSFPRLFLVDFGGEPQPDDPLDYDPSKAVRAELERERRAEETRALAEEFERAHEEDVRRARHRPLPAVVAAYRNVFGHLPEGWPHQDM